MSDGDLRETYADLLDEKDERALLTTIGRLERAFPRVRPPAGLIDRLQATVETVGGAPASGTPPRSSRWGILSRYQPVRRSAALALGVALTASLLGGAVYAMQSLGGQARPHVVQTCSGFGAHWRLTGAGARLSSPRQFVAGGGRLVPGWRRQLSGLQRPRYWVTPANADVVDTCRFSSSSQVEIGTNHRTNTQLLAMSVVPLWKSKRPTMVGSLRIPAWGSCAPKPARSPIKAPDRRPVAQLAHVPADLSRSVRVTFTPCNVPQRPVRLPGGLPPASEEVAIHVFSQVQYRGSAGTVVVLVARPSPAAIRPGLNLGTSAGTLPDGRRLWLLPEDIRWVQKGLIVSVSGTPRVSRLKALAADVVVK